MSTHGVHSQHGSPSLQVLAVERLGQDAGGGRLAGAPGPGEQVGVALGLLVHGVAQGRGDVVLAADLVEATGSVPPVQGLVGHGRSLLAGTDGLPGPGTGPPAPAPTSGTHVVRRRPGDLRHTGGSAESCCLPALTRFTGSDCTGPGRHLTDASASDRLSSPPGDVRERPNRHAWKACVGKLTVGSNPTVSATARPPPTPGRAVSVPGSVAARYRAVPGYGPPCPTPCPTIPATRTWMRAGPGAGRSRPADHGDVPIGAVVVQVRRPPTRGTHVVAARHNEREATGDPTAHAEVLALRDAAAALGRWRLDDCIDGGDPRALPDVCRGAVGVTHRRAWCSARRTPRPARSGTLYHLGQDPRLNHEFPVRARSVPSGARHGCGSSSPIGAEPRTRRRGGSRSSRPVGSSVVPVAQKAAHQAELAFGHHGPDGGHRVVGDGVDPLHSRPSTVQVPGLYQKVSTVAM